MGIVYKQSAKNTMILFLGFFIGGINALALYIYFLGEEYYGLITFLLSSANVLLPLIIFGMQNTVIKFFSSYKTKYEQDTFLSISLLFPLVIIIPAALIGVFAYEQVSSWISKMNPLIKNYTYLIFLVAIFMGYFELFYAWSKVKLESVFGNFIKEVFARFCASILLIALYYKLLSKEEFIYAMVIVYGLRMLIMLIYALYLYTPKFILKLPSNFNKILEYSFFIILSASAGGILLEIDKFMIPQIEIGLEKVAYYSVGVYIATVIGIPARAMLQIATPITAKDLNNNKIKEVSKLYKSSSLNMLLVGGLLFLLINLNVADLYKIINKPEYANGIYVVFMISIAKLFELSLGTNSAILSNSKYYKVYFYFSVAMAVSVILLNKWLITKYGFNGAALATMIVVLAYGFVKIIYIKSKLKMQPFSAKTGVILVLILVLFVVFYYLKLDFHPLLNIILRSTVIGLIYLVITYKLKISAEINTQIDKLLKR
jgi:O-antigen/teichoic acid export membrane protein